MDQGPMDFPKNPEKRALALEAEFTRLLKGTEMVPDPTDDEVIVRRAYHKTQSGKVIVIEGRYDFIDSDDIEPDQLQAMVAAENEGIDETTDAFSTLVSGSETIQGRSELQHYYVYWFDNEDSDTSSSMFALQERGDGDDEPTVTLDGELEEKFGGSDPNLTSGSQVIGDLRMLGERTRLDPDVVEATGAYRYTAFGEIQTILNEEARGDWDERLTKEERQVVGTFRSLVELLVVRENGELYPGETSTARINVSDDRFLVVSYRGSRTSKAQPIIRPEEVEVSLLTMDTEPHEVTLSNGEPATIFRGKRVGLYVGAKGFYIKEVAEGYFDDAGRYIPTEEEKDRNKGLRLEDILLRGLVESQAKPKVDPEQKRKEARELLNQFVDQLRTI